MNVVEGLLMAPILFDLDIKLIRCVGAERLWLSDNPVLKLNTFFARTRHGVHLGFASVGLQLIVPISPTMAFMFHDPSIYRTGPIGQRLVEVGDADVRELNKAQYMVGNENLYMHSEAMLAAALALHATHNSKRSPMRGLVDMPGREQEGQAADLLHLRRDRFPFSPTLSFCSVRRRIDRNLAPGPRDAGWTQVVRDFPAALEKGEAGTDSFVEFAENHPIMQARRRR